ncbi:MAG: phosphoribosylformylglycinamidine synthase subunit PurL [Natronomonas sp.]
MSLSSSDRTLVVDELGREPTPAEEALFENLWSEHCAYRSSRPLLSAFDSEGPQVVVGPGDDAAVVELPNEGIDSETTEGDDGDDRSATYITLGIESHNHPSYVDPFDGAATGVGGIVRDTMSMGAYPIALADSLYFGAFDRDHSRYLFEGVVEGIGHYGNCIGVPTVTGSVSFDEGYEGNPLVNVACIGLTDQDRLVTAAVTEPGNKLVLVGNATGRDGLGGASFASEDLAEDAETEDRPAVQVGDPYTEKLLIEANEELVDGNLIEAARDLGAAGFGGATSEMVAKAGLGAQIELDAVHQREPNMNALEILLAESQERMCYEVRPEHVDRVEEIAEKYDLGCSVVGEVTEGNYVCTFEGETVVDVDAEYVAEGAPMNDLESTPSQPPTTELPHVNLETAFEAVVGSPNAASKRWVYRQYDHEVGARTAMKPGDDAAIVAIREMGIDGDESEPGQSPGVGLAFSSGADPNWTACDPYDGSRAIALENATNIATKGATPLAAVDCLNGGNPEKPDVYDGFRRIVDGLADMCRELKVPVVGGNVSLYNDSPSGPIPPTPTLAMTGTKSGFDAPPATFDGRGTVLLVGGTPSGSLGGSEYLARFGGSDRFPLLPESPIAILDAIADVANADSTLAAHDVSHGGLAVTIAEMVDGAGAEISMSDEETDFDGYPAETLFSETPGRVVVETTAPREVRNRFEDVAPVIRLGASTSDGVLEVSIDDETLVYDANEIAELRNVIDRELE